MTYYGGTDLARSFTTVRGNTIQIAEEIPAEQYDFRPVAECRSVREILGHLLSLSEGTYQAHAIDHLTTYVGIDFPAIIRRRIARAAELSALPKAALVETLRADGERWGAFLASLTEDELGVVVSFPEPAKPPTKTRFEMLLSLKEHEMHHRAQLMVYERMLGLVPHLTRARQPMMDKVLEGKDGAAGRG
jgi:uncharacterized damage-inducible protein DinB